MTLRAHGDEGQDLLDLLGRNLEALAHQRFAHVICAALVQLVHFAQHGQLALAFGHAQAFEETAHQLAVVQLDAEITDAQLGEHGVDDGQHFSVVADAQAVLADHVDVALVELAEAATLGTLAAVHALRLVAAEREGQLVLVLGHVAGQRHGQVETQRHLRQRAVARFGGVGQRTGGLHEVHLALGLATGLGQQDVGQLEHRRFHRQEPEALVVAADDVQHALERNLLARQQFKGAGRGTGLDHGRNSCRNGNVGGGDILPPRMAQPPIRGHKAA